MSNPPMTVNLRLPSEAYREATGSLVYRLSELMFGSLLAAYCLGFVGAIAAAQSRLLEYRPLGIALLAAQYICISLMFTYLTTSFYLTYHVGILTLPKLPFDRLGRDFTIAVLQAVFFGLSLLLPALFPLLLAVNVVVSGRRKNEEYKRLAEGLFNQKCSQKARVESDDLPRFLDALADLLRSKRQLSVWAPIGRDVRRKALLAFFIGMIVFGLYLGLGNIVPQTMLLSLLESLKSRLPQFLIEWVAEPLLTPWGLKQLLITLEVLLATFLVYRHGRGVLGRRASFRGFPIKNLDFCKYPANATVEDFCKYQAHPQTETSAETRIETHLSDPGISQEAAVVQTDSQPNRTYQMDQEWVNLQDEVKDLCTKLFGQS